MSAHLDHHAFANMLRSLHNIEGYQLPELDRSQWPVFMRNPVEYYIRADEEQQAAIWREVAKRQPAHVVGEKA